MQPKTPRWLRRPDASAAPADSVDGLKGIIESEASRMRGNDLSALAAVLDGQAPALDSLVAVARPRATVLRAKREKISGEQTAANVNSHSR